MKDRALLAGTVVAVAMAGSAARAELPPQYTSWADLRAVVNDGRLEEKLRGVVEGIEFVRLGIYKVRSGPCHVIATVSRRGQGDPPIPGPSATVSIEVSERRCE
jgi:hypothetical protein